MRIERLGVECMNQENRFKKLRIHNIVTFEDYGVEQKCTQQQLENRMNDLHEQNKIMKIFLKGLGYDCIFTEDNGWIITEYTGGSDVFSKMIREESEYSLVKDGIEDDK